MQPNSNTLTNSPQPFPDANPRPIPVTSTSPYADTGCIFSPSCLSCPLPSCIEDLSPRQVQPSSTPHRRLRAPGNFTPASRSSSTEASPRTRPARCWPPRTASPSGRYTAACTTARAPHRCPGMIGPSRAIPGRPFCALDPGIGGRHDNPNPTAVRHLPQAPVHRPGGGEEARRRHLRALLGLHPVPALGRRQRQRPADLLRRMRDGIL